MKNNNDITFPVNEIFDSIDGEGITQGALATFIRLTGCNLNCSYCDTKYALTSDEKTIMSIDEIVERVLSTGYSRVTITGGEPLLQNNLPELINELIKNNITVNIETNGSLDISRYLIPGVIITMDYKCLSSNMESKMLLSNLELLRETDVLKFVIEEKDFDTVRKILKNYNIKSHIFLNPIFGKIKPYILVDFLKDLHKENIDTKNIKVGLQIHKIIWDPDKRGV